MNINLQIGATLLFGLTQRLCVYSACHGLLSGYLGSVPGP